MVLEPGMSGKARLFFAAYGLLVVGIVVALRELFGVSGAPLAGAAVVVAVVLFWGGLRPAYRRVDAGGGE
ncbi:hypothetical protein [Halobellus limi]|uniref:Uncharacterized protein n=1 Tax=Halobellus limi TaxID=699433 RepID=A0A1H5Z011_9EURY|nr:hypothetical protein [Halobellus limi]QCC48297.1 hypothetical protein DV707_11840 [Halobellus limi]SEG28776.1 hypothetical protein SAMN04488133_1765 [Halobellus limi]